MKLWQKMSWVFSVLLIVVVVVCSALLLINSKNIIVDIARTRSEEKHRQLTLSFSEVAEHYIRAEDTDTVRRAIAEYCFSQFADDSSVLMRDGETLYTGVTVDPSEYISADGDIHVAEREIQNRNIMIAAGSADIAGDTYHVYVVEDISAVYNSISDMIWVFIIISVVCIAAGTFSAVFLMRRGLRPISALASAARRISGGEYSMRADIVTNDEIGELSQDFNLPLKPVSMSLRRHRKNSGFLSAV